MKLKKSELLKLKGKVRRFHEYTLRVRDARGRVVLIKTKVVPNLEGV